MKAVSVRLERTKRGKIKGQLKHDIRKGRIPSYVDKKKTSENSIIILPKSEKELLELTEQVRANRKRKLRSDAILSWSGIITFGTEAQEIIENLTKKEQDELFKQIALKITEFLNTELTGLVVHRDETAIHAHFQIMNFNRDGEALSNIVKPKTLSEIQDIAGKVTENYGISRGKRKWERIEEWKKKQNEPFPNIVHRSVRRLHQELPREIEELEMKLKEKQKEIEETQDFVVKEIKKLWKETEIQIEEKGIIQKEKYIKFNDFEKYINKLIQNFNVAFVSVKEKEKELEKKFEKIRKVEEKMKRKIKEIKEIEKEYLKKQRDLERLKLMKEEIKELKKENEEKEKEIKRLVEVNAEYLREIIELQKTKRKFKKRM